MKKYLNLDSFIEDYINLALKLAKEKPTLENLDKEIRKKLAKEYNLLENEILQLHHAFHWTLFCEKSAVLDFFINREDEINSPIKITKKQTKNLTSKSKLIAYLNLNHRDYLLERMKGINLEPLIY